MNKKQAFLTFIFLFMQTLVFAVPVDFYDTLTSSGDSNMIKMTTDLFFNQFHSLEGYTVVDRRGKKYNPEEAPKSTIAFYAEINEDKDGSWICTLNAIKADENRHVNSTKKYASYYKILLDAKNSLENLFSNLSEDFLDDLATNGSFSENPVPKEETFTEPRVSDSVLTIDNLAGTWTGEDFIDKILILRGGRGFVIFKNGANMNVSVHVSGGLITVMQTSSTNASFFPEISRELALSAAPLAKPVEWELKAENLTTLSGSKKTLVEDPASSTGVSSGTIQVQWHKK